MQDGGANTIQDKHTQEQLKDLQSLRLDLKVMLTEERIKEFYEELDGNAYLSFSGGKDSTVLLNIARKIYPDIPAVFSNTGLEYPEIRKFAMSHENVEVVQPKMRFDEVISQYGYPIIGKEVAEAIYYARRIKTAAERERERKLRELHGNRTDNPAPPPRVRRRTELQGGLTENEEVNRRNRAGGEWSDWRRGCL